MSDHFNHFYHTSEIIGNYLLHKIMGLIEETSHPSSPQLSTSKYEVFSTSTIITIISIVTNIKKYLDIKYFMEY